jgi:hypothetical protein
MRSIAHIQCTWLATLLCAAGISGCSIDLAVSFCASEQQSISIDGSSAFVSSQSAVSIAVGDSVRLVARGACQNPGLRIVLGTRGTKWHSRDRSIVRLSPAPDSSARDSQAMATVWAVGLAPGYTVVSGTLGESLASVPVNVVPR